MYAYYALTTVGIQPPGKKYLTTMQITQFLVGVCIASFYFILPGCLRKQKGLETMELVAYASTISYVIPLTFLFYGKWGGRSGAGA